MATEVIDMRQDAFKGESLQGFMMVWGKKKKEICTSTLLHSSIPQPLCGQQKQHRDFVKQKGTQWSKLKRMDTSFLFLWPKSRQQNDFRNCARSCLRTCPHTCTKTCSGGQGYKNVNGMNIYLSIYIYIRFAHELTFK